MSLGPPSRTPNGANEDLPLWRKLFPIDVADQVSRSRREFMSGLSVAGGAMACSQGALNYVVPESTDRRSTDQQGATLTLEKKLSDIDVGEAIVFHYPNEKTPCVFVKTSVNEFVAFTQKCTHLACPVIPEVETGEFHCPCHHGAFEIRTGKPVSGPPRSPLRRVIVDVSYDGTLTASGFEDL